MECICSRNVRIYEGAPSSVDNHLDPRILFLHVRSPAAVVGLQRIAFLLHPITENGACYISV